MKTQIDNLINGMKGVWRKLEHPKYINAPKTTSRNDFAGTCSITRNQVAEQVYKENPNELRIYCDGITITLKPKYSCRGNFQGWGTELTPIQYLAVMRRELADEGEWEQAADMEISAACLVKVTRFARKSPKSQWHFRTETYIDEAFIEII